MPIRNRNLAPDARVRHASVNIDISAGITAKTVFLDPDRAARILKILVVYTVASNTGTHANIEVGVPGATTRYLNAATVDSQSAGTVVAQTVTNIGTLVAANTPLQVDYSGTGTNTGEVDVFILFELVDRTAI